MWFLRITNANATSNCMNIILGDLSLHIMLVFVETTLDSINPLILLVKKHIGPLRVKNCTKHLANSLHIRKFYKRMEKKSQVLLLHLECHQ